MASSTHAASPVRRRGTAAKQGHGELHVQGVGDVCGCSHTGPPPTVSADVAGPAENRRHISNLPAASTAAASDKQEEKPVETEALPVTDSGALIKVVAPVGSATTAVAAAGGAAAAKPVAAATKGNDDTAIIMNEKYTADGSKIGAKEQGNICFAQGDYQKALDFYRAGRTTAEAELSGNVKDAIDTLLFLVATFSNMCSALWKLQQEASALQACDEGLALLTDQRLTGLSPSQADLRDKLHAKLVNKRRSVKEEKTSQPGQRSAGATAIRNQISSVSQLASAAAAAAAAFTPAAAASSSAAAAASSSGAATSADAVASSQMWQQLGYTSLQNLAFVTAEQRSKALGLIAGKQHQAAIEYIQKQYGIGNPSISIAKYKSGGEVEGVTRPGRTPRISDVCAAFQPTFTDANADIPTEGIEDLLLAFTLAHEDTHRRQLWHFGVVQAWLARDNRPVHMSPAQVDMLIDLRERESSLHEVMAYHSELRHASECLSRKEAWNLTSSQCESLTAWLNEAQWRIDNIYLPGISPMTAKQATDPITFVAELERIHTAARAIDSAYVVERREDTMTSDFHTEDDTFTWTSTSEEQARAGLVTHDPDTSRQFTPFAAILTINERIRQVLTMLGVFPGQKMVTYVGRFEETEMITREIRGDFDLTDGRITSCRRSDVITRWRELLIRGGGFSVLLRQFTADRHLDTGLPFKRIRGFVVRTDGWRQLTSSETEDAQNTNSQTGRSEYPEPSEIYP